MTEDRQSLEELIEDFAHAEASELKEAMEVKSEMQALLKTSAWERLANLLDTLIETRRNYVELTPLGSLDAALQQEYTKGEIASFRLLKGLPEALLESAENSVRMFDKSHPEEAGNAESE